MPKYAYDRTQFWDSHFPAGDYVFPSGDGTFVATLAVSRWINKGLICYFDTDCGRKYKLCVWFSYDPARSFRPAESDLDISELPFRTRMRISYCRTRKGKAKWLTAEIVE